MSISTRKTMGLLGVGAGCMVVWPMVPICLLVLSDVFFAVIGTISWDVDASLRADTTVKRWVEDLGVEDVIRELGGEFPETSSLHFSEVVRAASLYSPTPHITGLHALIVDAGQRKGVVSGLEGGLEVFRQNSTLFGGVLGSIPKQVVQTWLEAGEDAVPRRVKRMYSSWTRGKEFERILVTDEVDDVVVAMVARAMRGDGVGGVPEWYRNTAVAVTRFDIARVAHLFCSGGVYADLDVGLSHVGELGAVLDEEGVDFVTCTSPDGTHSNEFFASSPASPFLSRLLRHLPLYTSLTTPLAPLSPSTTAFLAAGPFFFTLHLRLFLLDLVLHPSSPTPPPLTLGKRWCDGRSQESVVRHAKLNSWQNVAGEPFQQAHAAGLTAPLVALAVAFILTSPCLVLYILRKK